MDNKKNILKKISGLILSTTLLVSFSIGSKEVKADENLLNEFNIELSKLNLINEKNPIESFKLNQKINLLEEGKDISDVVSNLNQKETQEKDLLKEKVINSKVSNYNIKLDNAVPLSMKDTLINNLEERNEKIEEQERLKRLEQERLEKEKQEKLLAEEKKKKEKERLASLTIYESTVDLNIRQYANTQSAVVGMLNEGQTFEAYNYNDEWIEVVHKNKKAYVSKKYIKKSDGKSVTSVSKTTGNKVYNLTDDERILLEKLVEAEAGGQSYEGKLAVATVVANRVEMKGSFEDTITGVIYAKNQFSPTFDGRLEKMKPSKETKDVVRAVFDNGVRNLPKNIVYFCTIEIRPYSWIDTRAFYKEIDDHAFFYNYAK